MSVLISKDEAAQFDRLPPHSLEAECCLIGSMMLAGNDKTAFAEMRMGVGRDAFYQVLLHRTAKRKEGSGLGLGRIHAEAELDLSCQIDGDVVQLRAEGRFPREARA